MPEKPVVLTLNQEQQFRLFAQILTYLFSLTYRRPVMPISEEEHQTIKQLQEVAYSVRPWRKDLQASLALPFSSEAAEATKKMIDALQAVYEQWPQHKDSTTALQDLMMYRMLIEEAEQRASTETEGR